MEKAASLYESDSAIVLGKDDEYLITEKTLIIIKAPIETTISIITRNDCELRTVKGCSLFFLDGRTRLHVSNRLCNCRKIRLESVASLLVFMDMANGISEHSYSNKSWNYQIKEVSPELFENDNEFKKWLIFSYIIKEKSIEPLLNFIRASEEYQIIFFLLKKTVCDDISSIKKLCKEYGLSYSHFRRLCYKALGKPIKEELEKWKIMNTYFDCVEHDDSLTFHAINNGFSSSSHFSNAVKKFTGYSPRDLKNVNFIKKWRTKDD